MVLFNAASGRTQIDVAEAAQIAQRVSSGDANVITTDTMQQLLGGSALVLDGLRQRPRYFDGRFLTGADLSRDQDYVRQRQADMARAGGTGVVLGLQVTMLDGTTGRSVQIAAGQGITPSGDLVLISAPLQVDMNDLPGIDRLDATLGLNLVPRQPLARRTGLFILALRPVQFTANPIAAYPTTITGPRTVQDGDIIEATAVTLIPYAARTASASLADARRAVAREIFVSGSVAGMPQEALPLAMLALSGGVIQWIDGPMVRRETGAETPLQVALGNRPRALAEAHVLQYDNQLAEVLASRTQSGASGAFAASQYFSALPAAGQMPVDSILLDAQGFTQAYFPPVVDVDVSFIPSDEIAALVEESLALPPIDLLADTADLDATGVVVLVPVTRQRLQTLETQLDNLTRSATATDVVTVRRLPIEQLGTLLQRRSLLSSIRLGTVATSTPATVDPTIATWQAAWRAAIAAIPDQSDGQPDLLWYVRRRTVAYESALIGTAVPLMGDDVAFIASVQARIDALGLTARVAALRTASTPFAAARLLTLLGSARILPSDLLLAGAVRALEVKKTALGDSATLSEGDVLTVAETFGTPQLGDGLTRLVTALGAPALTPVEVLFLADDDAVIALDQVSHDATDAQLTDLAPKLRTAVDASDATAVATLLGSTS